MIAPEGMRRLLSEQKPGASSQLRAALDDLPTADRDMWLDRVLGIESLPDDGPELPRGCVPYMPCPVDLLLEVVDGAGVGEGDVFVDVGSGVGRATVLTHYLTGAGAIGIEIQRALAQSSCELARAMNISRVRTIEGDATEIVRFIQIGTVFFLYCPFSDARLARLLDDLEAIARTRQIRVCCVHLPAIQRPWLEVISAPRAELMIYRSACRAV